MAISYNTDLLDRNIAPDISKFTKCDAPDIVANHVEATHWLTNHFLNTLLGPTYVDKIRQYAINMLFRAEVAFRDYHEARRASLEFLENGRPDYPAIRTYFLAISRWESCLLNLQIFMDLLNKMKRDLGDSPVFSDNDGSKEQRAYSIANTIKHWGGDVASSRHDENHTIPIWLTNAGLQTRSHQLSFQELAAIVGDVAVLADELQNPASFGRPKDASQDG